MASIYARGRRLWCKLKDEDGAWVPRKTPYNLGDERAARRYAEAAQRQIDGRRSRGEAGPLTVRAYVARWIAERKERGVGSASTEETRLEKYVLPTIGAMRLDEVTPEHVRDLVRALRKRSIAPRTVLAIYNIVHNVFANAAIERSTTGVLVNPVMVKRGELPQKLDRDPEWRALATFTVREVEQLISDVRIPVERRVQYALKAIAGLRHGEAAAARWRNYDPSLEPLGQLVVAAALDSTTGEIKSTKTGTTRYVPVHPTLAKILASWKLEHWPRIYGRRPGPDDLIVPARTGNPVNGADAAHAMRDDLETLELRVKAGAKRTRGGHDLRSWFKTRTIEDGADSLLIRRITHAPPKDVESGYQRFSWAALCREVSKLRVDVLDGKILALGTGFGTAERKAGNRWLNLVTPKGLEPLFSP
jgi:integrase